MPGNSWRDRVARPGSTGAGVSPQAQNAGNPIAPTQTDVANNSLLSPQLNQLLQQRQQLENRMRSLISGGTGGDLRDAARFQVPTFAQRQAELRQWEARRERQQQATATAPSYDIIGPAAATPALRTGLRDFQQPVTDWLDARDRQRQQLREQARDRLAPVERAAQPLRNLSRQTQDAARQFRDLDQQLANEGLHEEREELRKLGADKLMAADNYLSRANAVLNTPQQSVKKIDEFWQRRDNDIRGAMDRFGGYVERSRQRLNSETGGSGDLFERMMRSRERALNQRREQQRQEQRDQARRDRALNRKKNHEDH
ncbi:hypothetical protein DWB84_16745 [Saccharophagus sp. K07]|uniref:hypothetical protein n=1 Tax=Saccharophagus sp. K07 TaxID=2283636 RepID=UPI001651D2C1|nr:hypothetical protein [Saccharophagus sp. K07]MBC6907092.1 hypothetical protein [Saccharophagus sp. K07]